MTNDHSHLNQHIHKKPAWLMSKQRSILMINKLHFIHQHIPLAIQLLHTRNTLILKILSDPYIPVRHYIFITFSHISKKSNNAITKPNPVKFYISSQFQVLC